MRALLGTAYCQYSNVCVCVATHTVMILAVMSHRRFNNINFRESK